MCTACLPSGRVAWSTPPNAPPPPSLSTAGCGAWLAPWGWGPNQGRDDGRQHGAGSAPEPFFALLCHPHAMPCLSHPLYARSAPTRTCAHWMSATLPSQSTLSVDSSGRAVAQSMTALMPTSVAGRVVGSDRSACMCVRACGVWLRRLKMQGWCSPPCYFCGVGVGGLLHVAVQSPRPQPSPHCTSALQALTAHQCAWSHAPARWLPPTRGGSQRGSALAARCSARHNPHLVPASQSACPLSQCLCRCWGVGCASEAHTPLWFTLQGALSHSGCQPICVAVAHGPTTQMPEHTHMHTTQGAARRTSHDEDGVLWHGRAVGHAPHRFRAALACVGRGVQGVVCVPVGVPLVRGGVCRG